MFQKVPFQPPKKTPCPIAFVGEAPGEEEVEKGQPFVGPAGRLFNYILRSCNMDRSDYLITNVFEEKADDNDCSAWMADRELAEKARERLAEELARFRPRCVVPLGGTALWAFTGHTGIDAFRGAVLPATKVIPGLKLLPTFHPARIFHQYKLLPMVASDFMKALKEGKSPKITYPDVTLLLEPTLKDALAFIQDCHESPLLSVDIETGWGQITCVGLAPTPSLAMCIPFVDFRRPNRSYWLTADAEFQIWMALKGLLENEAVPKLGQNFLYDAGWFWLKHGIAVRNYRHDTRLLHHARYPELPKSLGSMAANYTRLGAWKHWSHGADGKKDD